MAHIRDWLAAVGLPAPRAGVVLGSGLGAFSDRLENRVAIPYSDVEGMPPFTNVGHAGRFVAGSLGDLPVIVMAGRAHLYEGYSPKEVVAGVRQMIRAGASVLVVTNAAGAINLSFQRGSLVLISDHINLLGSNPLIGPNDDTLGPRHPDMSEAYPASLRRIASDVAAELGFDIPEGVYAAVAGPSFETPAEIRYLRTIGADLVGMSTVPEVIVSNHMGCPTLGISCVTNMAAGILPQKLSHEEVIETGEMIRETLVRYLSALIPRLVLQP